MPSDNSVSFVLVNDAVREKAARYCMQIGKQTDQPVHVKFSVDDRGVTAKQRAYYWALMGHISNYTGHTKLELDESYRKEFLEPELKTVRGRQVEYLPTISHMKRDVLSVLIDYVRRDGRKNGWALPGPEVEGL